MLESEKNKTMLTLTLTITQKPQGIAWNFEPDNQKASTAAERLTAEIMMSAIDEAMTRTGKEMGEHCKGVTLYRNDDPRPPAR